MQLLRFTQDTQCCHLCLHACRAIYRFSCLANTCVGQSERRPPSCVNQDAWVVITPKRTKANSIHTAAWHAWTRTSPLNFVLKAVFSLIHFPASFIRLLPSCHSDLGGSRHGWMLFLEQTEYLDSEWSRQFQSCCDTPAPLSSHHPSVVTVRCPVFWTRLLAMLWRGLLKCGTPNV